ncbi:ABC transporter permease [Roseateles paludis]|uniref:ABC transporter permease n=1 Tax=Roseateles paludis TaxID=3145238 RepID=A0ABV0G7H7_9BURK
MNAAAFFSLLRAELRLFLANRKAMVMSIVAPILIAAFFGSLFGGTGQSKPAAIPIGVVDLDQSPLSAAVVKALQADGSLKVSSLPEADAIAQVRAGKLRVAAVLPAGLGQQAGTALFGAGRKPEIQLHYDPSQAMTLSIVRGLLAQSLMQEVSRSSFSGQSTAMRDMAAQARASTGMQPERRDELVRMFESIDRVQQSQAADAASSPAASTGGGLSVPYTTREIEAVEPSSDKAPVAYNGYAHSFAGMGVQFLLMLGVDMAVGLLVMRRLGLWKRLRAAPLSRGTLLGSRVAATALICFGVFSVIWLVAIAAFGVRVHGSLLGMACILAAFALMTAAFGLFIAALGGSPEATRGLAILATLLMVMLGGAWVPSFLFPEWLQQLTLAIPTRWAVDGLDAMTWRGQGFADALAPTGVLLGFALAFGLLALWRFKWEE